MSDTPKVDKTLYNINPDLVAYNALDENDNPTGGSVLVQFNPEDPQTPVGHLSIIWQNGPRGREDGTLAPPNGAFVEDVIYAALQRLEFFQDSKYESEQNAEAIKHLEAALAALKERTDERAKRGVEGKHEV